ncbi:hypothetical protein TSMEX_001509 [Taenia solium]|eukprot:TsM_000328200 transcript=TsM_000328200 gene=TsM_000328200
MCVLPGGLFLALQFLILAVSSQKQSPWACLMEGEPCDQEVGQCCAGLSCHPTLGVCARCADLYQFCSRSKPCCEGTCRIVCT